MSERETLSDPGRRPRLRRTKIVATLGPVSRHASVIERLVAAGLDVVRINLSHGTTAEHAAFAAERLVEAVATARKAEGTA